MPNNNNNKRMNLAYALTLTTVLGFVNAWNTATFQRSKITRPQQTSLFPTMAMSSSNNNYDLPSDFDDESQHPQRHYTDGTSSEDSTFNNEWMMNPSNATITSSVEKKIRVARAQAEIDRILNGPDAPFDVERELQKVSSIAPAVHEEPEEQEHDRQVAELEQQLYQSVKQQDYTKAANIRKEISKMHIDDCGAVLQVNAAFYKAFSEKDLRAMESIWLKDGTATCIHPSGRPIIGTNAVFNSWKRMFDTTQGSFQRNWMEPRDIHITVKGASTAIVTCDEHVYVRRFVRGQKRQTELINKLTATNIFRKVGGKWYMTYHHTSWHADTEAAKNALRIGGKAALKDRAVSKRGEGGQDESASSIDGILGTPNFGPLLGPNGKDGEAKKQPQMKRIVLDNISDLFNGNLGDILSGENDSEMSGAIISFSRMDDDDDDDDDYDDDDDEDDDDDDDYEQESRRPKFTGTAKKDASSQKGDNKDDAPKDALRQGCISALRRLCDQGSISPKQKRVLLTDIIACSAKGEFSMVEVAYELLCSEGDDKAAAEEEFSDQCRVLATSLPESPVSTK